MIIFSLLNHKGGVGKSSIAIQLSLSLASFSSVLAVDLDPQANFSSSICSSLPPHGVFELLINHSSLSSLSLNCRKGLDLVAASPLLNAADELLAPIPDSVCSLRHALEGANYDFVIIDTPPHLRSLALNALVASDLVLIPALPDVFSSNGLVELSRAVELVRSSLNPSLKVDGIVLNRFKQTRLSRSMSEVFEQAASILHTRLYHTKIRDSIKLSEAIALKLSIFDYAPLSPIASDFSALFHEIFPSHF